MNETHETPEPLAAILAEMRDFCSGWPEDVDVTVKVGLIYGWACRIKEAAEREYEEAKNYFAKLHDGPSMICTAKNCAVRNIGLSLAAAPRKFDEAAFDAAVSKPNGWSGVADPVAEIRKMRGDEQPGNAAAMRDLLEKIRHEYGWGRISCRTCVSSEADVERVSDLFEKQIDAALAAPARNADRFADADVARDAVKAAFANTMLLDDIQLRAVCDWLFDTAEGGGHA